jgi:hypothetical protein
MLDLLLPHEGDVVIVEGDVQAKLREESEALGIGRHRVKTKLVMAPAITDPLRLTSYHGQGSVTKGKFNP